MAIAQRVELYPPIEEMLIDRVFVYRYNYLTMFGEYLSQQSYRPLTVILNKQSLWGCGSI